MRAKFFILPLILFTAACGSGSGGNGSNGNVISAAYAPPALVAYQQPPTPAAGYIWTPGYWAYSLQFNDYYWVPGTWVVAPEPGLLWTPPYWAWNGNVFVFNQGWWGPQVGFYGGIGYGFGYFGSGYQGGYWQGTEFYYNQAVTNVDVTVVRNVYTESVVNNTEMSHVSYNGGEGGIIAHATSQEESAARERHLPPTVEQTQHVEAARTEPRFRASANHGKPPVAATSRPGKFSGKDVVKADDDDEPIKPRRQSTIERKTESR